jgi:hypothetical protein
MIEITLEEKDEIEIEIENVTVAILHISVITVDLSIVTRRIAVVAALLRMMIAETHETAIEEIVTTVDLRWITIIPRGVRMIFHLPHPTICTTTVIIATIREVAHPLQCHQVRMVALVTVVMLHRLLRQEDTITTDLLAGTIGAHHRRIMTSVIKTIIILRLIALRHRIAVTAVVTAIPTKIQVSVMGLVGTITRPLHLTAINADTTKWITALSRLCHRILVHLLNLALIQQLFQRATIIATQLGLGLGMVLLAMVRIVPPIPIALLRRDLTILRRSSLHNTTNLLHSITNNTLPTIRTIRDQSTNLRYGGGNSSCGVMFCIDAMVAQLQLLIAVRLGPVFIVMIGL